MTWDALHPLVQHGVWTAIATGVLIAFVLLIRRPFAARFGAKAAYLLWALPLARLVMPPLPESWALSRLFSFNDTQTKAEAAPSLLMSPDGSAIMEAPMVAAQPMAMPEPIVELTAPTLFETVSGFMWDHAAVILVSIWLLGTIAWLTRSFRQQHVFMQLVRDDSEPSSEALQIETREAAKRIGLKRLPEVRSSLLCAGPLVTGLKNPVVLLPMWFEEDYTREEQRDAIVHELMHLKRRDLWAFQVARIVAATQWLNPFAVLALRAFRTDQEAACDADVLKQDEISPAAYGRTLVKAARLARPSDRRIASASLTLAHPIKERIIMMTRPTPSLKKRLLGGVVAVGLGAAALVATASYTASATPDE
ncbi:MAG: M56 family metallopeptidase, partial [Pseudomonadota bacterium]